MKIVIFRKIDRTEGKPNTVRQILHVFSQMWNLDFF
jgi:hypothetical protein